MAVFRVVKDKDNPYVILNKYGIYDENLSYKAKGILNYCLSRPDNWEFYLEEISKHSTDKIDSVRTGIQELINNSYIVRKRKRDKNGKFKGYEYTVHEVPQNLMEVLPKLDNPTLDKPTLETPNTENPMLLNNDSLLSNDYSSRSELEEIINYYCLKANISPLNVKPKELEAADSLIKANISVDLIKRGIDYAFANFQGDYDGDKIKSFRYCEPVVRSFYAKIKAKEGAKDGANSRNTENELGKQGIGL